MYSLLVKLKASVILPDDSVVGVAVMLGDGLLQISVNIYYQMISGHCHLIHTTASTNFLIAYKYLP